MSSDEARRVYHAGRTLALRSGDRASLVRLDFGYGAYNLFATAELQQGFQLMASAVRGADELGNRPLAVAVRVGTGRIALDIGPLSVTVAAADRAIELASGDLSCGAELTGYSPLARHVAQRSAALAFAGDLVPRRRRRRAGPCHRARAGRDGDHGGRVQCPAPPRVLLG